MRSTTVRRPNAKSLLVTDEELKAVDGRLTAEQENTESAKAVDALDLVSERLDRRELQGGPDRGENEDAVHKPAEEF